MSDANFEKLIEHFMLLMLIGFLCYGLYEAGNEKSFDAACHKSCAPARSITPVIDFENQCMCDEGHGKWRYQDIGNR